MSYSHCREWNISFEDSINRFVRVRSGRDIMLQ